MVDRLPNPDLDSDSGVQRGESSAPGLPRWVTISGVVAIVIAILFVVLLLAGGHDPGRH